MSTQQQVKMEPGKADAGGCMHGSIQWSGSGGVEASAAGGQTSRGGGGGDSACLGSKVMTTQSFHKSFVRVPPLRFFSDFGDVNASYFCALQIKFNMLNQNTKPVF